MGLAAPSEVLDFWFSPASRERWFASTPQFDQRVTTRFLATWHAAVAGELEHWADTQQGALALVILCDQFPLHMFRGRPEAFAGEAQARAVARRAIAAGFDRLVTPEQRGFFYLPFMHSELPANQEYSVALYQEAGLEAGLRWALHHRDLIRRFGRFPHRNRILGRESSAAELSYLQSDDAFRG